MTDYGTIYNSGSIFSRKMREKWGRNGEECPILSVKMAERGGFEPPVEFDPYDGLANRSFRPLRHLSATVQNVFYTILRFRVKSRRILKKNKKTGREGMPSTWVVRSASLAHKDKSLTWVVRGYARARGKRRLQKSPRSISGTRAQQTVL